MEIAARSACLSLDHQLPSAAGGLAGRAESGGKALSVFGMLRQYFRSYTSLKEMNMCKENIQSHTWKVKCFVE